MGHLIHFHVWFYVEGFWGRQIKWIYFQLNQIQEVAARHPGKFWKNISLEWVINFMKESSFAVLWK